MTTRGAFVGNFVANFVEKPQQIDKASDEVWEISHHENCWEKTCPVAGANWLDILILGPCRVAIGHGGLAATLRNNQKAMDDHLRQLTVAEARAEFRKVLVKHRLDLGVPAVREAGVGWLLRAGDEINCRRLQAGLRRIMEPVEAVKRVWVELKQSRWTDPEELFQAALVALEFRLCPSEQGLLQETQKALNVFLTVAWTGARLRLSTGRRRRLLMLSPAWNLLTVYLELRVCVRVECDPALTGLDWRPVFENHMEKVAWKFARGILREPADGCIKYLVCALIQGKQGLHSWMPSVVHKAAASTRRREISLHAPAPGLTESVLERVLAQPEPEVPCLEVVEIARWDELLPRVHANRMALKTLRLFPRCLLSQESRDPELMARGQAWLEQLTRVELTDRQREELIDRALVDLPLTGPGVPADLTAEPRLASRSARGYELYPAATSFFAAVQGIDIDAANKRLKRLIKSLGPVLTQTGVDPFQVQAWIMEANDADLAELVEATIRKKEEPARFWSTLARLGSRIDGWLAMLEQRSGRAQNWLWRMLTLIKREFGS